MVNEASKLARSDDLLSRFEQTAKKLVSTEKVFQKLNVAYKENFKRKDKYKNDLVAVETKHNELK